MQVKHHAQTVRPRPFQRTADVSEPLWTQRAVRRLKQGVVNRQAYVREPESGNQGEVLFANVRLQVGFVQGMLREPVAQVNAFGKGSDSASGYRHCFTFPAQPFLKFCSTQVPLHPANAG
jgi:hypothetical protein